MFRSISLTILATFLGQAFGFFADIFIANSFGTSWKADAYFLAMVIPIILADLFMACINAVFIPSYMTYRKEGAEAEFFNATTTLAMFVIAGVAAVAFFLSPVIIGLIAGKFTPEARVLTVSLTKMLLLLAVTMPLATILSSRLNAHDQFALPALGKSFNFGFIILSLVFLKGSLDIYSLPAGFLAGSLFFILTLIFLFYRSGLGYSFSINPGHPAIKETAVLILPLIASTMVNYANIFIERSIAAGFSEGSISALNYSFKTVNIPLNLFVLGGMTVIMPVFSKYASEGDMEGLREITLKGLSFVSFIILPVSIGIAVFREPLIKLLYERGAFSAQSSGITATAMFFYSFGILGLSLVHIMYRVFYAIKDIKTLASISIITIIFNILLIFTLSRYFGFIGIPLSFSITSTLQAVFMIIVLGSRFKNPFTSPFVRTFSKHALASAVMGGSGLIFIQIIEKYFDMISKMNIAILLLLGIIICILIYMAASLALGIKEVGLIKTRIALKSYSEDGRP